jgi:glycosyltransferase involved in cell wall biosynthesis
VVYCFQQFLQVNGFGDVFVASRIHCALPVAWQDMSGEREQRDGCGAGISLDQARGGPTVHFGHGKVHYDQVGHLLARRIDPITAVHRQEGVESIFFKDETHKLVSVHVVFNDEDAPFAHHLNILRLNLMGNEYNHGMRLLFVTDARSPISRNWMRYFTERGDEVFIASTFDCELVFPVQRLEFTPVAFSAAKKRTSTPSSASSRTLSLRTKIRQWLGPLTVPVAARRLLAFIRDVRPDIVHAMRVPYEGMLTASALQGLVTRPSFLISIWGNDFTLHAPSTPLMRMHTRRVMQSVDGLHADTERDVRLALKWGLGVDKATLVAPGGGGVRSDVFYPPVKPVQEPVVINPRGVRPYVRNDSFFKAIPLVLAKRSDAKFLCTSMQGETQAMQWVQELGIADAVELMPPVPFAEMGNVFRRAQIVVSPSVHDGTPNSLIEAMACGCFPIAGDLESIREWITHTQNGLLVNAADPQSIADAILLGLEREDLRYEAAGLNAEIISAKAEYGRTMGRVVEFYKSVIRNP